MPVRAVKFTATLWPQALSADCNTITEARQWAESYGTTADQCVIRNRRGDVVAVHMRDHNDNGLRWFKGTIGNSPRIRPNLEGSDK